MKIPDVQCLSWRALGCRNNRVAPNVPRYILHSLQLLNCNLTIDPKQAILKCLEWFERLFFRCFFLCCSHVFWWRVTHFLEKKGLCPSKSACNSSFTFEEKNYRKEWMHWSGFCWSLKTCLFPLYPPPEHRVSNRAEQMMFYSKTLEWTHRLDHRLTWS